jgi:exonuclease III
MQENYALYLSNFQKSKKVVKSDKSKRKTAPKCSSTFRAYKSVDDRSTENQKQPKLCVLNPNLRNKYLRKRSPTSHKPASVYRVDFSSYKSRSKKQRAEKTTHGNVFTVNYPTDKSLLLTYNKFSECTLPTTCNNKNYGCYYQKKLLESNDVEVNPGPNGNKPNTLDIISYNINGLKDFKKQKRIFNHLNKLPNRSQSVINIQETHLNLKDIESIKYHWKWGAVHSPSIGASAGVSILYNESYFDKIIGTYCDERGRLCSFTAQKNGDMYCFINIYAYNNHNQSILLFNELDILITNEFNKDSSTKFYISGDFNLVMDDDIDSIGRNQSQSEKVAVANLKRLMTKHKLIDSYRSLNNWGGFTWGRNNPCYLRSRLDMILISKALQKDIFSTTVNITPKESDHSWLAAIIKIDSIKYGKGIVRCNSSLLANKETKERILNKLTESINEIPNDWNPHQKLDFIKVKIRDYLLEEGREKAKERRSNLFHTNKEIEKLTNKRENLLIYAQNGSNNIADLEETFKEIDELTIAIDIAEMNLVNAQKEEADRLIFRSKVKWAEEGEKSTKYFFNLLKQRQEKMQIRKIISNRFTYYRQDDISKAIFNFYKKLYQKQNNLQNPDNSTLLQNLPKLTEEDRSNLAKDLTLDELKLALETCKESAPGIDGITYDTYKHTWDITGPYILESWKYSLTIEQTSPSQKTSVITLLEKKVKTQQKSKILDQFLSQIVTSKFVRKL